MEDFWKKCSSCKKPIDFGARYYVCSVSTCNGQRTGYVFCSVPCFEVHLPSARHKDAAAIEMRAPAKGGASVTGATVAASTSSSAPGREPVRKIITGTAIGPKVNAPKEVLIIASRMKEYIQARGEMNTSGGVVDVLSEYVRIVCDRAIEKARADGRKTVMERDFDFWKA